MIGPFSVWRAARFARVIDPGPRALDSAGTTVDTAGIAQDEETRKLVNLTDRLRTGHFNGAPSPEFRIRLRAQLVSLAETQLAAAPAPAARHGASRRGNRRPAGDRPRAPRSNPRLALVAGALSALVACGGLTVVVSGHALPGDTLYSLKRTTEHVELALAHGDQAKAERHLAFAQARARELADLVRRDAPGAAATPRRPLVATALDDMDRQTRVGVRTLAEFAVTSVSDAPLADLASWAADQRAILQPVLERLHGDAGERIRRSASLLSRIRDRVTALRGQLTCTCLDRSHGDDLGPLPCWPCDPRGTPQPQAGTPPVPRTGDPPGQPSDSAPGAAAVPTPGATPGGTASGTPSGTSAGGLPQATSPPNDDPSLLPPVIGEPTGGGGLLPPILPTGVLPPLLSGLLPGLLGG